MSPVRPGMLDRRTLRETLVQLAKAEMSPVRPGMLYIKKLPEVPFQDAKAEMLPVRPGMSAITNIAKNALPLDYKVNCFIALHMNNRMTGSQGKWTNPGKGHIIATKDAQKTEDQSARRQNMKKRITIRIPTGKVIKEKHAKE